MTRPEGPADAAPYPEVPPRPDVPAHLIGPPGLVEAAALWGWGAGLIPAPDAPLRGMEEMRDLILSAWSTGGPVRGARR